jgi:hypothetical protein
VPWTPELFSAPALQSVLDKYRREHLRSMPFFDGLLTGEVDALVASFSGVPELHHPVLGRVKGEAAFRRFVADMSSWLAARDATIENVNILLTDPRGVEEVVLHLDGDNGRVALPLAIATDHAEDERIVELRLYFSTRPLTGHPTDRLPLLQPDHDLETPDVVDEYLRALTTDGAVVEPCTVTDDGRTCALEYNMVARGRNTPQPGLAVLVRGNRGGGLAATRAYGEIDPI